jgi:hypothetical protein
LGFGAEHFSREQQPVFVQIGAVGQVPRTPDMRRGPAVAPVNCRVSRASTSIPPEENPAGSPVLMVGKYPLPEGSAGFRVTVPGRATGTSWVVGRAWLIQ